MVVNSGLGVFIGLLNVFVANIKQPINNLSSFNDLRLKKNSVAGI